eukprot:TRINITY_DN4482_c0_g1_i15.p1 TRINITY_DN4482_c0_g1~~TRINITY_DN4482_c0_g1_i15.p1  ORF type:complete len:102 (-),score=2.29 TRINITY_DN4482_c0_g1_i15:760-1065(-)
MKRDKSDEWKKCVEAMTGQPIQTQCQMKPQTINTQVNKLLVLLRQTERRISENSNEFEHTLPYIDLVTRGHELLNMECVSSRLTLSILNPIYVVMERWTRF